MDADLRLQLLRAAVRDQMFLKGAGRELSADDFTEPAEKMIAKRALWFYREYSEPAENMVRSYVEDDLAKLTLGAESRSKLEKSVRSLLDTILGAKVTPVSVKALTERVHTLHKTNFFEKAVDTVIEAQHEGNLTAAVLAEILEKANRELADHALHASDIMSDDDMVRRDRRRIYQQENQKFPYSMIDELDRKIKLIPRGYTGLLLAPYSSGKGLALLHFAIAYAMQGYNVWFITLEDAMEEVEDRFDSCMTGLPKSRLYEMSDELRARFRKYRRTIRGRIKITDWTEEDCTVEKIERGYEVLKTGGFVPDVIIVDYDDEMKAMKEYKGESARRYEFAEIYRSLRKTAKRLDVWLWTAAQTGRAGEGKKIITGKDTAEDISKIRKVAIALGIGTDPDNINLKHIYVIRHKMDRSRFGVDIMSDFSCSIFYDRDATADYMRDRRSGKKRVKAEQAEADDGDETPEPVSAGGKKRRLAKDIDEG